ncbi:MAG TPA: DUF86 domain-containing protein [Thermoanaerobaculia bacterium]|nr:DUF86 domain-containing protein [Thermoanaerobaculia bacterium]
MKDDRVYLKHMLRCISRIEEYTAGGPDSFFSSHLIQDGVIRNLQTMAESTQRLSERLKALHSNVAWKALAGFRNVLVHDYLGVDLDYVYRAVEQDVPRLKLACEAMLQDLDSLK